MRRPIRHGTTDGYSNRGCRCDACRDAWAFQHRDYMRYSGQADVHRERRRRRYHEQRGLTNMPAADQRCPGCGRVFVRLDLHVAQTRRREGNVACINQVLA